MTPRIRVLVVDDSAFARKVVREVLSEDPRIEVIGYARDGLDALERIAELRPDVVTLDLMMPELDGLGVLQALVNAPHRPRVVLVTMTSEDSKLGVAALEAGAFDAVQKPTALATELLYELRGELTRVVIAAGAAQANSAPWGRRPRERTTVRPSGTTSLLVIGASTGGPRAIGDILCALPGDLAVPVAVVVHMPPGYTEAFARRIASQAALEVREAEDGMVLRPGTATVARAGTHLHLRRQADGTCLAVLDHNPITALHRPSVDALFTSAATWGRGTLAVVLTGMGNDGTEGARAVRAAGGRVLTESASSCVVYGMPRSVTEAGLSDGSFPLVDMPRAILDRL